MNDHEFAAWCAFFQQLLLHPNEDPSFLVEWQDDMRRFTLDEGKQAVMFCAKTVGKFDKGPKTWLSKILGFIRDRRFAAAAKRKIESYRREADGGHVLLGEAWEKSEERRRFLAVMGMDKKKTKGRAAKS